MNIPILKCLKGTYYTVQTNKIIYQLQLYGKYLINNLKEPLSNITIEKNINTTLIIFLYLYNFKNFSDYIELF